MRRSMTSAMPCRPPAAPAHGGDAGATRLREANARIMASFINDEWQNPPVRLLTGGSSLAHAERRWFYMDQKVTARMRQPRAGMARSTVATGGDLPRPASSVRLPAGLGRWVGRLAT